MKILTPTALLLSALLVSSTAAAEPNNKGHKANKKHYNNNHVEQRYDNRHDRKARSHKRGEVLRLELPVYVRGNDRIHLRQIVSNRYGIDTTQYRLKKVVVNSRGHRQARAKLVVGKHYADKQFLQRGKNAFHAPRYTDGRWILGVKDARIDTVRVVLEPKRHWAYQKPYGTPRPWYQDSNNNNRRHYTRW